MKKSAIMFFLLLIFNLSYGSDYLTGDTTPCPGANTYEVKPFAYLPVGSCFYGITSVQISNNGTASGYGSLHDDDFVVNWTNTTTGTINATITFTIRYATWEQKTCNGSTYYTCDDDCNGVWYDDADETSQYSVGVTIQPNSPTPSYPTAISKSWVSGYLFDLSTSSSNATSYEWSVTGATIQGASTGSTVRVLATSCSFSFSARGKNTSCDTQYSSWRNGNHTITTPAAPSYVSGPSFIYSGQSVNFTTNSPTDPGVISWSIENGGGVLYLGTQTSTYATVHHNGSSAPLTEAKIKAYRFSMCGTSSTTYAITRFGGSSGRFIMEEESETESDLSQDATIAALSALALYPNPAHSGDRIKITLDENNPLGTGIKIFNLSGSLVKELAIDPKQNEFETIGLQKGIYVVKYVDANKTIKSEKLIIN